MDILRVKEEILAQLPLNFRQMFTPLSFQHLQEIRFRCGKPLMVYGNGKACFLSENGNVVSDAGQAFLVHKEDMVALLSCFCENSVYSYQNEICDGFLTIGGGHRVGICGRAVFTDGKISNITDISGLNIRIAKEYIGCAQKILPMVSLPDGTVANTILIAPPQCGKTTFLRDLTRLVSKRFKVTLIDERSEIAAVKEGVAQLDVGTQTDVLDRFPKNIGMVSALRSLSPEVMVTDEVGSKEDAEAIKGVLRSGCRIITSMHAYNETDLCNEKKELYRLFDKAVILSARQGVPRVEKIADVLK